MISRRGTTRPSFLPSTIALPVTRSTVRAQSYVDILTGPLPLRHAVERTIHVIIVEQTNQKLYRSKCRIYIFTYGQPRDSQRWTDCLYLYSLSPALQSIVRSYSEEMESPSPLSRLLSHEPELIIKLPSPQRLTPHCGG